MTKHLTDTLQQRHLDYMQTTAASCRAESAPTLDAVECEYVGDRYGSDRCYLGSFTRRRPEAS